MLRGTPNKRAFVMQLADIPKSYRRLRRMRGSWSNASFDYHPEEAHVSLFVRIQLQAVATGAIDSPLPVSILLNF